MFQPSIALTAAFVALTAVVVAADVYLVRRAAPAERRGRWTAIALGCAVVWLAAHAGLAASGVLEGDRLPPPVLFYLFGTMLVGVAVATSPIGRRLATLPLGLLVGLHAFRLLLEMILHALHESGDLPVQMTWSGYNLDVVTGATAAVLGLMALRRPLPRAMALAFNLVGSALLLGVMAIAVTSAPTPMRQFMNDPPVLLAFHAPFNWVVGVHVWTALVGHIVIFRAIVATADAPR